MEAQIPPSRCPFNVRFVRCVRFLAHWYFGAPLYRFREIAIVHRAGGLPDGFGIRLIPRSREVLRVEMDRTKDAVATYWVEDVVGTVLVEKVVQTELFEEVVVRVRVVEVTEMVRVEEMVHEEDLEATGQLCREEDSDLPAHSFAQADLSGGDCRRWARDRLR